MQKAEMYNSLGTNESELHMYIYFLWPLGAHYICLKHSVGVL